jgi:hypothetical protein
MRGRHTDEVRLGTNGGRVSRTGSGNATDVPQGLSHLQRNDAIGDSENSSAVLGIVEKAKWK